MKKWIIVLTVILTMLCTTVFASAASDPAVTIINPVNESMVYSDSLLISVKITQPKTIRVYVNEKKQVVNGTSVSIDVNKLMTGSASSAAELLKNAKDVPVCDSELFTCSNNLTFFTKQVNQLEPGVYEIRVDTLNSAGEKVYSSSSLVAMVGKLSADEQSKIIDTTQNGALNFFKDLIKNFFK